MVKITALYCGLIHLSAPEVPPLDDGVAAGQAGRAVLLPHFLTAAGQAKGEAGQGEQEAEPGFHPPASQAQPSPVSRCHHPEQLPCYGLSCFILLVSFNGRVCSYKIYAIIMVT